MIGPIKIIKALRAVARITMDPRNLDEVFVLADLSEESESLREMVAELEQNPIYGRAMRERPRLGALDQDALSRLPDGTLGREYARFMTERGHRHEDLLLVEGESAVDFVRNHFRESHDLWHVTTGFDTDVAGELGLQALYAAQLHGPLPILLLGIGMLNTLLRSMDDLEPRMNAISRGWLLGRRAKPMFGVDWKAQLGRPLEDLRRELALDLDAVDAQIAKTDGAALAAAA